MIETILEAIGSFFRFIGKIISYIVEGIMTLAGYVVGYFKGLKLRKGRDIPFIADERKLADLIHKAPTRNVGIFEGTYNEDTGEIENPRILEADEVDDGIRNILRNEKLVVLS